MSASTDATVGLPAERPAQSALAPRIIQFRRLLAGELGCSHDELVFDEINDVHCRHCGKDFTD
jgi:hypothetical protein